MYYLLYSKTAGGKRTVETKVFSFLNEGKNKFKENRKEYHNV